MNELRIAKDRLLRMCARLTEGEVLYKDEEAARYGCSLRSIQRDFDDRNMENGTKQKLIYDRMLKGYRLEPPMHMLLSDEETFAVIKILLESRSLTKREMKPILKKLVDCCVPKENKQRISKLIANEEFHYVEPHHNRAVLKTLWELSKAVQDQRIVNITYDNKYKEPIKRVIKPVGILFSEFYFYMIAFIVKGENEEFNKTIKDYAYPALYRIDRIRRFTITDNHFPLVYANRFEEGEYRKRIQFMWPGKLQKVKFYVQEESLEAVLDRLPTAKVIKQDAKGYLITAEVFGEGIDMWLRSQGEWVEVVE